MALAEETGPARREGGAWRSKGRAVCRSQRSLQRAGLRQWRLFSLSRSALPNRPIRRDLALFLIFYQIRKECLSVFGRVATGPLRLVFFPFVALPAFCFYGWFCPFRQKEKEGRAGWCLCDANDRSCRFSSPFAARRVASVVGHRICAGPHPNPPIQAAWSARAPTTAPFFSSVLQKQWRKTLSDIKRTGKRKGAQCDSCPAERGSLQ